MTHFLVYPQLHLTFSEGSRRGPRSTDPANESLNGCHDRFTFKNMGCGGATALNLPLNRHTDMERKKQPPQKILEKVLCNFYRFFFMFFEEKNTILSYLFSSVFALTQNFMFTKKSIDKKPEFCLIN